MIPVSRVCCAFTSSSSPCCGLPSRQRSSRVFIRVSDVVEVGRTTPRSSLVYTNTYVRVYILYTFDSLSLSLSLTTVRGQRVRSTCSTCTPATSAFHLISALGGNTHVARSLCFSGRITGTFEVIRKYKIQGTFYYCASPPLSSQPYFCVICA